ncbi:MAG: N-acetylmuramoyl-L-alanine amidase [Rhodospirillales bacterium]|nr:N-acetylmuramoyl-L-alanine amidase [Rhodospirillales bacterium]MSP79522.1 N-acetylmuramoyl-L-alanine amidase [Rhodospirillales bacterium]
MLVLHYTGLRTCTDALDRLCDPAAKVSAHYLIDEDGTTYALVAEDRRAWHAGVSFWRGERDVNGRSLGIELVNPGHEFGYRSFPEAQMQALLELGQDIVARHPIPARNVVGHSDVAPARKQDPGELFDWPRLSQRGIGLWPNKVEPVAAPESEVVAMLGEYGYDTAEPQAAILAFQRHFHATRRDGVACAETAGRIKALLRLVA